MNLFEHASRNKLRFASPKGDLSVEDLWDLPLTSTTGKANLDDIARDLYHQIDSKARFSFVNKVDETIREANIKFEIVKTIIETRLKENADKLEAATRREKKAQIMALIAQKQTEALSSASIEDLTKMMEAL
jgi:hypothetical protein